VAGDREEYDHVADDRQRERGAPSARRADARRHQRAIAIKDVDRRRQDRTSTIWATVAEQAKPRSARAIDQGRQPAGACHSSRTRCRPRSGGSNQTSGHDGLSISARRRRAGPARRPGRPDRGRAAATPVPRRWPRPSPGRQPCCTGGDRLHVDDQQDALSGTEYPSGVGAGPGVYRLLSVSRYSSAGRSDEAQAPAAQPASHSAASSPCRRSPGDIICSRQDEGRRGAGHGPARPSRLAGGKCRAGPAGRARR